MKRAAVFAIISVLLFALLCGCSKTIIKNADEIVAESSVSMTYDLFDGVKEYKAVLSEDGRISVGIATDSGVLKIKISQDGSEPIYEGNIKEDFAFSVNAAAGEYDINVYGMKHSGSYSFKWW